MRILLALVLFTGCAFDAPENPPVELPDGQRCEVDADTITCAKRTYTIATGAFGLSAREVHFMLPEGEAPETGWPVAILFQGSLHSAEGSWQSREGDEWGGYHETELIAALLEAGFAVLTPEARYDGATYWDSNVVPYNVAWDTSEDHQLMLELFDAIDDGAFGPLDGERLFAAGISSGGYMTSRMAVSYPGRFTALAIQSASYATCAGPLCDVPELPRDHPPTLFLHGANDEIVPESTMQPYADALEEDGVEVAIERDEDAGHQWLPSAPGAVVAFFATRSSSP